MTIWSELGAGALAVSAGLAALHFSPYLVKRRAIAVLRETCRANRWLALTYDDGPGRELTPMVLDLLAAHNARATFFLLGRRVPGAESIVERIASVGHELGCHSLNHLNAWEVWPSRALEDVRAGYLSLERWLGPDAIFRPPHGKLVYPVWQYLRQHRAPLGWWTEDSGDTHMKLPDPGICIERARRSGGGVILLHDFDRDAGSRQEYVLRTTEGMLKLAKDEGLTVLPLGELLRRQQRAFAHG